MNSKRSAANNEFSHSTFTRPAVSSVQPGLDNSNVEVFTGNRAVSAHRGQSGYAENKKGERKRPATTRFSQENQNYPQESRNQRASRKSDSYGLVNQPHHDPRINSAIPFHDASSPVDGGHLFEEHRPGTAPPFMQHGDRDPTVQYSESMLPYDGSPRGVKVAPLFGRTAISARDRAARLPGSGRSTPSDGSSLPRLKVAPHSADSSHLRGGAAPQPSDSPFGANPAVGSDFQRMPPAAAFQPTTLPFQRQDYFTKPGDLDSAHHLTKQIHKMTGAPMLGGPQPTPPQGMQGGEWAMPPISEGTGAEEMEGGGGGGGGWMITTPDGKTPPPGYNSKLEDSWEIINQVMTSFKDPGGRVDLDPPRLRIAGLSDSDIQKLYRSLRVYSLGFHQSSEEILSKISDPPVRRAVTHEFWAAFARIWDEALQVKFASEQVRMMSERFTALQRVKELETELAESHLATTQASAHVNKFLETAWQHNVERAELQTEAKGWEDKWNHQRQATERETLAKERTQAELESERSRAGELETTLGETQTTLKSLQKHANKLGTDMTKMDQENKQLRLQVNSIAAEEKQETNWQSQIEEWMAKETSARQAAQAALGEAAAYRAKELAQRSAMQVLKAGYKNKQEEIEKALEGQRQLESVIADNMKAIKVQQWESRRLQAQLEEEKEQHGAVKMELRILEENTLPGLREAEACLREEVIRLRPAGDQLREEQEKLAQKRYKKRLWKKKHGEAEVQISELNNLVENLRVKFQETHGDLNALKLELAHEVAEKENAWQREEVLQERIKVLEDTLEDTRTSASNEAALLSSQILIKEQEKVDEVEMVRNEMRSREKALKARLEDAASSYEDMKKRLTSREEHISNLMAANLQFDENVRKAEDRLHQTTRELSMTLGQLKRAQARLSAESNIVLEDKEANSWLESKTDEITQRYIEEQDKMKAIIEKLKKELGIFKGDAAEKTTIIESQNKLIEELKEKTQAGDSWKDAMETQIKKLTFEVSEGARVKKQLENEIIAGKKDYDRVIRVLESKREIDNLLAEVKEEKAAVEAELEKAKGSLEVAEAHREELNVEVDRLQKLTFEQKGDLETMLEKVADLGRATKAAADMEEERNAAKGILIDVHERSKEDRKNFERTSTQQQDQIDYLSAYVDELKDKLARMAKAKEVAEAKNAEIIRKMEHAKSEAASAKLMKSTFQSKSSNAERKMKDAKALLEMEKERAEGLQKQVDVLGPRVQELESRIELLRERNSKEDLQKAFIKLHKMEADLEDTTAALKTLRLEKTKLEEKVVELTSALEVQKKRCDENDRFVEVTLQTGVVQQKRPAMLELLEKLALTPQEIQAIKNTDKKLKVINTVLVELQAAYSQAKEHLELEIKQHAEEAKKDVQAKKSLVAEREKMAKEQEERKEELAEAKLLLLKMEDEVAQAKRDSLVMTDKKMEAESRCAEAIKISQQDQVRAEKARAETDSMRAAHDAAIDARILAEKKATDLERHSELLTQQKEDAEKSYASARDARAAAEKARGTLTEGMMSSERARVEVVKQSEIVRREKDEAVLAKQKMQREYASMKNERDQAERAKDYMEKLKDQAYSQVKEIKDDVQRAWEAKDRVEDAKAVVEDKLLAEARKAQRLAEQLEAMMAKMHSMRTQSDQQKREISEGLEREKHLKRQCEEAQDSVDAMHQELSQVQQELCDSEMRLRAATEGPKLTDLMSHNKKRAQNRKRLSRGQRRSQMLEAGYFVATSAMLAGLPGEEDAKRAEAKEGEEAMNLGGPVEGAAPPPGGTGEVYKQRDESQGGEAAIYVPSQTSSGGAECIRFNITTARVTAVQMLCEKIEMDVAVYDREDDEIPSGGSMHNFAYDFFIIRFHNPQIAEMHLAAFLDACMKFSATDPILDIFARLIQAPGVYPLPQPRTATAVLLALVSELFFNADGPEFGDFNSGRSKIKIQDACRAVRSILPSTEPPAMKESNDFQNIVAELTESAIGGMVGFGTVLERVMTHYDHRYAVVTEYLEEKYDSTDQDDLVDGRTLENYQHFESFVNEIDTDNKISSDKIPVMYREATREAIGSDNRIVGSAFATIASKHGVLFFPPIYTMPQFKVPLEFNEFHMLNDSLISVLPNINRLINDARTLRYKTGEPVIQHEVISGLQDKIKAVSKILRERNLDMLPKAWEMYLALIRECHVIFRRREFMDEDGTIFDMMYDDAMAELTEGVNDEEGREAREAAMQKLAGGARSRSPSPERKPRSKSPTRLRDDQ